jgi:hypothetical protein
MTAPSSSQAAPGRTSVWQTAMASSEARLRRAVGAVRLRYVLPVLVLLIAAYLVGIHPWMMNWGSTAAERQMSLPGDGIQPELTEQTTQAITIDAPPEIVWQWLVQEGQDRAGFYTYTWLENLIGIDIHNADRIHPEWQHLSVGESWRLAPKDYLWGLGEKAVTQVLLSEPGHVLVLQTWGAFVLETTDAGTTRFIARAHAAPAGPVGKVITTMVWDPVVFTLNHRMLLGLKARAEGRPDANPALMAIAHAGWVGAGVVVAGLFLSNRRRRYWLVLPVAAALPGLGMASDVQAGLAAFLSVGITVLGFLIFGPKWWGPFLLIAAAVLLTLLLASNAYVVIGLGFTLLLGILIAALVAEGAASRRASPALSTAPPA